MIQFTDKATERITKVLEAGESIRIAAMSAGILKDTTVDYIATLQQEGFVFNNPAANTTCGCGSSFS